MAYVFPPLQLAPAMDTTATAVFDNCSSIEPSQMPTNTWKLLDKEFRCMLAPVSEGLNHDIFDTTEATELFTSVLRDQLIQHGLLKEETQEGNIHQDRAMIRTRKRLAQAKNTARKNIRSSPKDFLTAVRTHNLAVRGERELLRNQEARKGLSEKSMAVC